MSRGGRRGARWGARFLGEAPSCEGRARAGSAGRAGAGRAAGRALADGAGAGRAAGGAGAGRAAGGAGAGRAAGGAGAGRAAGGTGTGRAAGGAAGREVGSGAATRDGGGRRWIGGEGISSSPMSGKSSSGGASDTTRLTIFTARRVGTDFGALRREGAEGGATGADGAGPGLLDSRTPSVGSKGNSNEGGTEGSVGRASALAPIPLNVRTALAASCSLISRPTTAGSDHSNIIASRRLIPKIAAMVFAGVLSSRKLTSHTSTRIGGEYGKNATLTIAYSPSSGSTRAERA